MTDQNEDKQGEPNEDPNRISVVWALLLLPLMLGIMALGAYLRLLIG